MSTIDPTTTSTVPTTNRGFRMPLAIKNGRLILALFITATLFNLLAALGFVGGVNYGLTTGYNDAPGMNGDTFWGAALPLILGVLAIAVIVVVTFVHHRLATLNRNAAATVMFAVGVVVALVLGILAASLMLASDSVGLALIGLAIFVAFTLLEIATGFGLAYLLRVK